MCEHALSLFFCVSQTILDVVFLLHFDSIENNRICINCTTLIHPPPFPLMGLYELFLQDPSSRLELHYRKIKSKQFLLSKVRKIITNIYILLTHHSMGLENLLFVSVIFTLLFGQMLLSYSYHLILFI
jgi:hypothetical protein